jgi:hypothetical protein
MIPTTPITIPAISPAEGFEELVGVEVVGTVVCVCVGVGVDKKADAELEEVDVVTVAEIIYLVLVK